MARSTVHYADKDTNNILKKLHNKLRPAGTPVQRVEYIIELLLLRVFEVKLVQDPDFAPLRAAFRGDNEGLLFSSLLGLPNDQILPTLNTDFFPFYAHILSAARRVWRGNLTDKVQDQLVLIEEVFGNSNFTNNVTSGNMGEIIGLVADLDKDRLLKTDLLGDTIESALSETGGTKDIGLHRTPDHIRQFMVGLAAPTFQSRLFDPTVGTGGFMFDSFEYVLEGVTRDGHWPGAKAHPELAAWFKAWFERHPVEMPSIEVNTDFYRTGVGGIEYLGMVRKMAAINFYVRGLNPGNIQQGDALEKFGSEILPNSKTIILANPPFGAQRDKESYPNVWSEYPTESETTILFVKLMLETIKPGGVCVVVVSEGFLTWDQNSARALRRALLDECDLQAIIGLPQGLFVSKGGQGPKTSILLFVKGRPTERVWFFKVTNDGYSMGTNRKPIPGCQLVEALDLFHAYVRQGLEPPESRHAFCIPAEWIKTLDPRIKDRIRSDTRAEMAVKRAEDLTKLEQKWAAQIAAKRLTEGGRLQRFAQHADLWEAKTQNEIARKIERAHLYSFNLSNYRSGLTPEQLAAWSVVAAGWVRENGAEDTLEQKYRAIAAAPSERLDELLSGLDPRHTLELDWARQFLAGVSADDLERYPHLGTLQEIIASQQRLPRVKIRDVCHYEKGRFPTQATLEGPYPMVVTAEARKSANDFQIDGEAVCVPLISSTGHGKASMHRIHYEKGKFAVANLLFALQAKNPLELSVKFIYYILGARLDQLFVPLMKGTANVALKLEDAVNVEFPLPPIEEQEKISARLDAASELISGVNKIRSSWSLEIPKGHSWPLVKLSDIIHDSTYGSSQKADYSDSGYPMLRIGNIGFCQFELADIKRVSLTESEFDKFHLEDDDFLIVRSNGNPALVGKCAVWSGSSDYVFASYLIRFRFDKTRVNPRYVMYYLMSQDGRMLLSPVAGGGTYNISATAFQSLQIPFPLLDEQNVIVKDLDKKLALQADLVEMRDDAQKGIQRILNSVWES